MTTIESVKKDIEDLRTVGQEENRYIKGAGLRFVWYG